MVGSGRTFLLAKGISGAVNADAFGYEVLGPIFAEFALRLWSFQRGLPNPQDACLLFCARGGLRLQSVYDRTIERTGLTRPLPSDTLMVSRLVAARTVANAPTQALLDELGREFQGRMIRDVAAALTQRPDLSFPPAFDEVFRPDRFVQLIAESEVFQEAVKAQNAHFLTHLDARSRGRSLIILCDTGLYGSTVRLLRDGIPERRWLSLQFARSNYKGYPAPHFDCTAGLSIERDVYAPWDLRSSALRFWHLIEAVLEPPLPSVTAFVAVEGGEPRSNLESDGWRERIAPERQGLFAGICAYVDDLTPSRLPGIGDEALRGWRRLKRSLIWPAQDDLAILSFEDRSCDFGRDEPVAVFGNRAGSLADIRGSLWREGALMRAYPRLGRAALALVELGHTLRALRNEAAIRNRRRNLTTMARDMIRDPVGHPAPDRELIRKMA